MPPRIALRDVLNSPGTVVVGGAHDALSARLVDLAGFDAVWLSSLGMSAAQKALPDIGLLTSSEVLNVTRNTVPRITIPLIVDCEDGYGDLNNVSYAVQQFEQAGASAISIDDNEHPKRNSFYSAERDLVPLDTMVLKLGAAKRAKSSGDFVIIARTEAMIAQLGVSEALRRADAYVRAGADALVVHSRKWDEIKQFMSRWPASPIPLIVIPTAFPMIAFDELCSAGFKVIIYANQSLRAAVRAMRATLAALRQKGTRTAIDEQMVTLEELERVVGLQEFVL